MFAFLNFVYLTEHRLDYDEGSSEKRGAESPGGGGNISMLMMTCTVQRLLLMLVSRDRKGLSIERQDQGKVNRHLPWVQNYE